MHAFVDVGDRVARRGNQCIAAALGFAHLRLDATQAAARLQVGPLRAHQCQQMLGAMAQRDRAHAMRGGFDQCVLFDAIGQLDDRDVLAAAGNLLLQGRHRNLLRLALHRQVDLPGQHAAELFRCLRA